METNTLVFDGRPGKPHSEKKSLGFFFFFLLISMVEYSLHQIPGANMVSQVRSWEVVMCRIAFHK
jgi:hypothetical protein